MTRLFSPRILRRLWPLLDTLVLLLLGVYIVAGMPLAPFHADESTQIQMSRDFERLFLQGDLAAVRYDADAPLTAAVQLRLINGTLSHGLMGLTWWVAGYTGDQLPGDWDWGADWDYNVASGRYPSADLLMWMRLPSTLLLAASLPLMFWLGRQMAGRPAAYLAALLLAVHPALLLNGRRAMMEGALTFFSLLTIACAVTYVRRQSLWAALALGLAGGLTVASKHTGAAVVASAFGAVGLLMAVRSRSLRTGLHLMAATTLVVATFYLLNPAWWGGDPLLIGQTVLRWRSELIAVQTQLFQADVGAGERLWGLLRLSLGGPAQMFEVAAWGTIAPIQVQISAYTASGWGGLVLPVWGQAVFGLLALVGLCAVALSPQVERGIRWVVLAWVLAMVLIVGLSPVVWQRYTLPLLPVMALLAALGSTWLLRTMWDFSLISRRKT